MICVIDSHLMIKICHAGQIGSRSVYLYDLYDLYDLAHIAGWYWYNLHDVAHVSWVGSVLYRSPAQPLKTAEVRN